MRGTNGTAKQEDAAPRLHLRGRSFVVAANLTSEQQRRIERAIETRGGSIHTFLNPLTDVLVVGRPEGNQPEALWAREQIRRSEDYRSRWGHLEVVTEEALRAALGEDAWEPPSGGIVPPPHSR